MRRSILSWKVKQNADEIVWLLSSPLARCQVSVLLDDGI